MQNNLFYVTPDADEVLNALLLLLLEIFEDEIELLGEDEDDFLVVIASAVGQLSQRISGVRITSYYEETVTRYSDCTFRSYFRLSRSAFEKLLQLLEPSAEFTKNNNGGKDPVPIAKQLLVSLVQLESRNFASHR